MDKVWVVLKGGNEEIVSIHRTEQGAKAICKILIDATYDDYEVGIRELFA